MPFLLITKELISKYWADLGSLIETSSRSSPFAAPHLVTQCSGLDMDRGTWDYIRWHIRYAMCS